MIQTDLNYDEKCQLLILGNSQVGKTSILSHYKTGKSNQSYLATVGLDFFTKDQVFGNKTIRVKIWDTAGQERYKSLTQGFFRNAQGIIMTFDVTDSSSFYDLKYWIKSIKDNTSSDSQMPVILIGNKIDLVDKRVVTMQEAKKFAEDNHYKYFETSAMDGTNIDESINYLVKEVLEKIYENKDEDFRDSITLDKKSEAEADDKKKKKRCCF